MRLGGGGLGDGHKQGGFGGCSGLMGSALPQQQLNRINHGRWKGEHPPDGPLGAAVPRGSEASGGSGIWGTLVAPSQYVTAAPRVPAPGLGQIVTGGGTM